MTFIRSEILKNLRQTVDSGVPIIASGAGLGLSARCEELGGVDFIIADNAGENRMQGRPESASMLPIYDANGSIPRIASHILPVVKNTPVICGCFAQDLYRDIRAVLEEVRALGFFGVVNSPTLGAFDGSWEAGFTDAGCGYDAEVEMIRMAHEMGFLTTPFVHNAEQAAQMAQVGADILICDCGISVGGVNGSLVEKGKSLEECAARCQAVYDAAVAVNPDIFVLCHGGHIVSAEDVSYIFKNCKGVVGYYGTTGIEVIPTETAISTGIRAYKNVKTS